ncbi:spore germination protein [Alkalihalobacillus sp. 1P02AB]|uniref:spore germination protein n=1 Tax=Alkalihalobacillus sp. 1P02AB TaxID=3132260 RepID=UPI0039A58150
MFSADFKQNKQRLKEIIGHQADLVVEHEYVPSLDRHISFFYFGEIDPQKMEVFLNYFSQLPKRFFDKEGLEKEFHEPTIRYAEKVEEDIYEAVKAIYQDRCILLLENIPFVYILNLKHALRRNLEESKTERAIKGPKVSFIEDIQTNVALIRRFAEDGSLVTKEHLVVTGNKQKVVNYVYHKENTDPVVITELQERLNKIKQANIEDSGKIESLLDNSPFYSPFPQVQSTDRIDPVLAGFEEGRIAVFVDGSPFACIVPTTLEQQMQAADDYYDRWMLGSTIRILRYVALFITLFVPPIYIALVSFHQGLIPDELSLTIINTRMNVPFPAVGEVVVMTLFVELLREASIRLPNPLGQTIGLVGGVVIGQAVVDAHIVSSIMVIIIAVTAISSFAVPIYSLSMSFRLLSFIAIAFSAVLGLYGVVCFFIILSIHLSSLHNYGVHYFSFEFSLKKHGFTDLWFRLPTILKDKKG